MTDKCFRNAFFRIYPKREQIISAGPIAKPSEVVLVFDDRKPERVHHIRIEEQCFKVRGKLPYRALNWKISHGEVAYRNGIPLIKVCVQISVNQ